MDNEKNWYPKYPSIHVSKENWYPCIQVSMYPWYPSIHLSKYPTIQKKSVSKISKYPDIRKKWYPSIPSKSWSFKHRSLSIVYRVGVGNFSGRRKHENLDFRLTKRPENQKIGQLCLRNPPNHHSLFRSTMFG